MRLEEGPLALTKIELSFNYKSERETSTSFILSLYTSLPSTITNELLTGCDTWTLSGVSEVQYKKIMIIGDE